jgi:hypothetical protein
MTDIYSTGGTAGPLTVGKSRTLQKLENFGSLQTGWHYGSGGPIDGAVLNLARELHSYLLFVGFTHTDAFPAEDGEVLLTAYHKDHYIGVIIEPGPNHSFSLNHEINRVDSEYVEGVTKGDVQRLLRQIARSIWSTPDSSTHQSLITTPGNSATLPLRSLPALAEECLSSNWSVREPLAA